MTDKLNFSYFRSKTNGNEVLQNNVNSKIFENLFAHNIFINALTHNILTGLQGGQANEYYHLTSAEYTGTGTGVFVRQVSPTIAGTLTLSGNTAPVLTILNAKSVVNSLTPVFVIDSSSNSSAAGTASIILQGNDNKERIGIYSANNTLDQIAPLLNCFGFGGTIASPTKTLKGSVIGGFSGAGYQQTTNAFTGNQVYIRMFASEDFTSTAQGTRLVFETTLNGTTTRSEKWRIDNTGSFSNTGSTGTAYIHLKAGTATASTAPLKFTSGTLLSSPEAGAIEFLTDAYYGTITTGSARKTFAFLESPSFTTPNLGVATATSISCPLYTVASGSDVQIRTATSDGTDNKRVRIGGGGDFSVDRGAYINIFGNEYTSKEGCIDLIAGNVANGSLRIFTGNLGEKLKIDYSGNFSFGGQTATCRFEQYNNAQLGATSGDYLLLSRWSNIEGAAATNAVRHCIWAYRDSDGNDYNTYRLHDAIGIQASYQVPRSTTKTYWERDPIGNVQYWGTAATDYMILRSTGLSLTVSLLPETSDGVALGSNTKMFSDAFFASGGVINWNNGNFTITHGAGILTFSGGTTSFADITATTGSFSELIKYSVDATVTASTTQSQGERPLTKEINNISVCANDNDVVTLPVAAAGYRVTVINSSAKILQIFPASGDDLGAGVNTSTTLAAGQKRLFESYDTTNYR